MMNKEIDTLIEAIKYDYANYTNSDCDFRKGMIKDFNNKINYTVGKKYTKILTANSVWGFIVNQDDEKFRAGDILKAASYSTPAKNKARGNILDGNYAINWTGPNYL